MSDRELLELAANAAGLEVLTNIEVLGSGVWIIEKYRSVYSGERPEYLWNPLDDDGDALRLAANLRLEIIPGKHAGDGCSVNPKRHQVPGVTVFRDSKDMAEQIRRAVVMCAAEIGRSME